LKIQKQENERCKKVILELEE
jgi:uncharacterized protein YaiL (DUF2058 family)